MAETKTKLGVVLLACVLATIVLWAVAQTVTGPPPMTPRRLAWLLGTRLFEGHGCPDGAFDTTLVGCRFPAGFSNEMTYISKPNGISVSTSSIRGKSHELSDFRTVAEVDGYSVILWVPAHVFFVIHEKKLCLIAYDAHDIRDWGAQRGLGFSEVTNLVQLDAESNLTRNRAKNPGTEGVVRNKRIRWVRQTRRGVEMTVSMGEDEG